MTKYQIVPVEDTDYWLKTCPSWFPLFDTDIEAWQHYSTEEDGFADSGIGEVTIVERNTDA